MYEFFLPRGGWYRAAHYIKHRLRRLPDPPHRIARGIFAGVLTTFTPFYGMHFATAAIISWVLRGNILAAVLATFFGNPLTYIPIITMSMYTGYWLLGMDPRELRFYHRQGDPHPTVGDQFIHAWRDLWHNFKTLFMGGRPRWEGLSEFYDEVFFPFLIGGIIPGLVAGMIAYYLSLPIIQAYQKRRESVQAERLKRRANRR